MPAAPPASRDLAHENEELRQRLREAEELIAAVREGTVDSLAVPDATAGPRYATREGADHSYRTLVENMSEGAALLGPDGLVLYANAALASLLAAPLPQLPAGQLTPYVPAAYQPYWTELLTQAWATPVRAELPLRTTTGQLRPCAVSINALFINEVTSLALLVTDLSDRRRLRSMQAQMAEQTTRLHLQTQEISAQREATAEVNRILEGIPQIAWSTDVKGQNYYVNQRWADFTGERPVDFVRQLEERVHPDDRVAALARWLHSMRSGEPLEMEFRVRNAADDYRWLLARARPAHDEQGQLRQWIGTYTDIQEQKLTQARVEQAQRQLREKNEQLTRLNVDLDTFVYAASHDLKQPVNNIDGLLTALLDELPAERSRPVQDILRLMSGSVERFQRTIDQLTDISKLQRQHATTEPLPVAGVVRGVALDLAPLVQRAGAELSLLGLEECPPVLCSEKSLRGIVYNLLSNALKYRAPERPVQVRLRAGPAPGNRVRLSVEDNGLGMSSKGRQKLFGLFERLHNHVEGSGIGLFMVKKMVENAGGSVEVESELDVGSTFSVYLPRPAAA